MEKQESVKLSSIVFHITPTQILFMILAAIAIGEEIILHCFPVDFLCLGGLYALTLFLPSLILIACKMSQRVGYSASEKQNMDRKRLRFVTNLEKTFNPAFTLKWTLYCIGGVLGIEFLVGMISKVFALQIVFAVEYGFFTITLAIVENLACQVAFVIAMTSMLLYPRKSFGIPCFVIYFVAFITQGFEIDPVMRILINIVPIIIFAIFFPLARRDIEPPSRAFNYVAAIMSAIVFFTMHFTVYGLAFDVWIEMFGIGLVMAFTYIRTRNVAITTWSHVLLNIITLPALILTLQYYGMVT